ncbi:MAG TPA: hypothetical protein VK327_02925 [Candidatus Paceibacterota bacterium]|nr:hypothetical protein [Candidatus Paceibacterota bacterium]
MMKKYFSRLNPKERRFVVGVGLMFFLVVNVFWVWPRFKDWGDCRKRLGDARLKLSKYEAAIQQKPKIEGEMKKLASEGSYVPQEDQAIQFLRTIQVQAGKSGVGFQGSSRTFNSTNQFFMEQGQTVTIVAGETNLVDFLYNIGSGNSLVRVREISIRPDPQRQQLNAYITLVASFQKSVRSAAPAPAKPAAQPANPISKPTAPKPALPNKK